MATKVLDLDLAKPLPRLTGLQCHARALALLRWNGTPVGQVALEVVGGRVLPAHLREAVRDGIPPLATRRLHDWLAWDESAASGAQLPDVTVAVCTRDRSKDLGACLRALRRLPEDGQELIVVDNRSRGDETRQVVESVGGARYLREDAPGLNAARNRALREARAEVVAFTDDDTVPDPGWLRALRRNFADPFVACVTGLTFPLELETPAQEWFERHCSFSRGFRRTVFGGALQDPLAVGGVGAGANMAVRRSALEEVGCFDEALDAGTPTRSGGDNDLFSRLLARGFRIVYDPAALNWHRHRRTARELQDTLYGYGVGVYAAWTRALLVEGELGVPWHAWGWFRHGQLRALARSLARRPGSVPPSLVLAELRGCAAGPFAYVSSRLRLARRGA
ncbi:MAG: glycosyltransferase family 2 protein [Gemmatimonadota bacterium]